MSPGFPAQVWPALCRASAWYILSSTYHQVSSFSLMEAVTNRAPITCQENGYLPNTPPILFTVFFRVSAVFATWHMLSCLFRSVLLANSWPHTLHL